MNSNKGFTMVELIVVILIIAVLSVVVMLNFAPTNKKARDNRRAADLEKYRIALEVARQIGTTYPDGLSDLVTMSLISGTAVDPKGYTYYFNQTGSGVGYTLRAAMEDLGSTNRTAVAGCGSVNCNYEVNSP